MSINDSDGDNAPIQHKVKTVDANDANVLTPTQEELLSRAIVHLETTPTVLANEISCVEGVLFSGVVATFTIPDQIVSYRDFSATIDWGDGSTTTGTIGPDLKVKASHTYVKFGLYALKVSVSANGASHSNSEHAIISNAPITASGFNLVSQSTKFKETVASFTDGNPFGSVSDYNADIFWGDGKSSTGAIFAAGTAFKVVGSHGYAKHGQYVVTVSIRDQGGATATATTHLSVGSF